MDNEGKALPVEGTNETRVPDEQDVVKDGKIIGRDPDPNVRRQIAGEHTSKDNG